MAAMTAHPIGANWYVVGSFVAEVPVLHSRPE